MKIRVKFEKYGVMKFIGHLDIMRYFQKAIRRADIHIAYSEGYSPHQIMSFASPLGVGITSEGEYFDIEVHDTMSSKKSVAALNAVMVEGIKVSSCRLLADDSKNAMSIVAAADYQLRFREGYEPSADWQKRFLEFYSQSEIKIVKKTKKSEKEINIKPYIYEFEIEGDGIFMQLSTGSVTNIKPELVMEAYYRYLGVEPDEMSFSVHRMELYADLGEEDNRRLVSLEELGEEIGE